MSISIKLIPALELIRLEENTQYGTLGVLKINQQVFCCTLEPYDALNRANVSSIPAQQYDCKKIVSSKFGETYEILDVPGRTNILFHAGNEIDNTEGCILIAEKFGKIVGSKRDRAILNSGHTFFSFIQLLKSYNNLLLTIKEVY